MCTDSEGTTDWTKVEVVEHPRSTDNSFQQCVSRCNALGECQGFVFWFLDGQCRTYRACDELICDGCHEYLNSQAFKSTTSTTTTTESITVSTTATITTVSFTATTTATITTESITATTTATSITESITATTTATTSIITVTAMSSVTR